MDLDEVADELYALPLERFIEVRTEREKQARGGGDRELAASIRAQPKPTTVAWLANQLARRHADEVGPLLDLGAALREATASLSGEQLRTLTRQRHQVVQALIAQARALAAEAGHRMTDDTARGLAETLTAALGDQDAARRLAAGRLTEGLRPTGFGGVDSIGGSPTADQGSPAPQASASVPGADERRRRAEQAWQDARRALEEAREQRTMAHRTVERTATAAEEAKSEVERLVHELNRAEQAAQAAGRAAEHARTALVAAEEEVQRAQGAEREAQHRLAGLS